jgi:hypothetical protein
MTSGKRKMLLAIIPIRIFLKSAADRPLLLMQKALNRGKEFENQNLNR